MNAPFRVTPSADPDRSTCGWNSVLVIEPRPAIRAGLTRELRALRMEPVPFGPVLSEADLAPLVEGAGRTRPVLIADGEGARRAISLIRRAGHGNPILAYQDFRRSDRAVGLLEAGADQVLTLPIRGPELEARIIAIQRRSHGTATGEVRTGPLCVPLDRRPPTIDGEPMTLPEGEAALLRHLALSLGRPVSRDRLYELLYETSEAKPYLRILDRYVCNLRRRIAERWPEGAARIRTLSGYGYALDPDPPPPRS